MDRQHAARVALLTFTRLSPLPLEGKPYVAQISALIADLHALADSVGQDWQEILECGRKSYLVQERLAGNLTHAELADRIGWCEEADGTHSPPIEEPGPDFTAEQIRVVRVTDHVEIPVTDAQGRVIR